MSEIDELKRRIAELDAFVKAMLIAIKDNADAALSAGEAAIKMRQERDDTLKGLIEERARLDEVIAAMSEDGPALAPCRIWKRADGLWQYEGTKVGVGETERDAIAAAGDRP